MVAEYLSANTKSSNKMKREMLEPRKKLTMSNYKESVKGDLIKHRNHPPIMFECSAQIILKPLLFYHHNISYGKA